jgi:hypothetical protein
MCSIFRVRKKSSSANDMGSVEENCYHYLLANKVPELAQKSIQAREDKGRSANERKGLVSKP